MESQRIIIIIVGLKCAFNKVYVQSLQCTCTVVASTVKLSEDREVLQKFTPLQAAVFARFKRVLISFCAVAVLLAAQHVNHM